MAYEVIDQETVTEALARLPGWTLSDDGLSISKSFRFATFAEAFGFMAESALAAEKLNHHPDWMNSYSRVDVTLTTHAKGRLTDRDIRLAQAMEKVAARRV